MRELRFGVVWLAVCLVLVGVWGVAGGSPLGAARGLASEAGGTAVDHSAFDAILKAYVDKEGLVDYGGLARDVGGLDAYIRMLGRVDVERLSEAEHLALLINAYNAFTLKLITEHYRGGELGSIMEIPEGRRWDHERWVVAGGTYSLNQIEHELIRPVFNDARIHFVLVCAAESCPLLRRFAYTGEALDEQMELATRLSHSDQRWAKYDDRRRRLTLTKLYEWYGEDFVAEAGSVEAYAARYMPDLKRALEAGRRPRVDYVDYSWALNAQE
ncbi:DUF547 domain-containing protein [Mucisphaera sp.]|uniref:DUF547 domain-containing protein n=1 Tax=Mucisphaera sp. TaxID=2913024 RepID=UPI003D0BDBDA